MKQKDFDLPDPKPRPAMGKAELGERRWILFQNIFLFSVFYGCIHKVFVPFFLSNTHVLVHEYTEIDTWALPAILLALYIYRYRRFNNFASLLSGVLIGYATFDTHSILTGKHLGWLALSHFVSSVPQGVLALSLLTFKKPGVSATAAWIGGLGAILFLLITVHQKPESSPVPKEQDSKYETFADVQLDDCGLSRFQVQTKNLRNTHNITLSECGFSPPALQFQSNNPLTLYRRIKGELNLHAAFFDRHGLRKRYSNRIIKPTDDVTKLNEFKFLEGEIAAIIYSDTSPKSGSVLVFNSNIGAQVNLGITEDHKLVIRKSP